LLYGLVYVYVTEFWKITLWAHLKQLEFLLVYHYLADITKTHFKYFYTFPGDSKQFYCIRTIKEQKAKF